MERDGEDRIHVNCVMG